MTLASCVHDYYKPEFPIGFPKDLFCQLFHIKQYFKIPTRRRRQVEKAVNVNLSDFYPPNQPWILRNLTMREYVRADTIALNPEQIQGPHIEGVGFGEVILSHICWSTNPSIAMVYDGNIHKGIWAGHRFDITTFARHREETKEIGWRDASEEAAKEIASIWEIEYGNDWREDYVRARWMYS